MIISSFQEELNLAPVNPTSAWNNPYGNVMYGSPIPVGFGGLGAVVYNKGRALLNYSQADLPGERSGGISGLGQVAALATANPILGSVAAGLSIAQMISAFTQPSQTGIFKQDATTLVNGLEQELRSVGEALQSNPTCANQQSAISFFWQAWSQLTTGCAQFGGPGTACVNDRAQGGKYSWWTQFLNPWTALACSNTTESSSDATSPGTSTGGVTASSISSLISNPVVLAIGAGLIAMMVMGGGE